MSASLYAQFIMEREGFSTLENARAFATYKILGSDCYIRDIYVHPEHRKSHEAAALADQITEIARALGCTKLMGSVCPAASGSTSSLRVLLAYGFKLRESKENFIVFEKEII